MLTKNHRRESNPHARLIRSVITSSPQWLVLSALSTFSSLGALSDETRFLPLSRHAQWSLSASNLTFDLFLIVGGYAQNESTGAIPSATTTNHKYVFSLLSPFPTLKIHHAHAYRSAYQHMHGTKQPVQHDAPY